MNFQFSIFITPNLEVLKFGKQYIDLSIFGRPNVEFLNFKFSTFGNPNHEVPNLECTFLALEISN